MQINSAPYRTFDNHQFEYSYILQFIRQNNGRTICRMIFAKLNPSPNIIRLDRVIRVNSAIIKNDGRFIFSKIKIILSPNLIAINANMVLVLIRKLHFILHYIFKQECNERVDLDFKQINDQKTSAYSECDTFDDKAANIPSTIPACI